MESEKNGVKFWLKARTVGLCAAFNRLLGYHSVRSTKKVVFLSSLFIKDNEHANRRTDQHLIRNPDYPDPLFYLSYLGKYFFRNASLLHLRVEQFVRYLFIIDRADADESGAGATTDEDFDEENADETRFVESTHRHFDAFMEQEPPGKRYLSRVRGLPSAKRREHSKLAVSRYWQPEPIGQTREAYYQQRLLLALPWYCDSAPTLVADGGKQAVLWTVKWARPASLARHALPDITLQISSAGGTNFSYEERCHHFESLFSASEFVCKCCDGEVGQGPCDACRYAVGFHVCPMSRIAAHRWCRNTLFGGLVPSLLRRYCLSHPRVASVSRPSTSTLRFSPMRTGQLDVQRCLFNLHRRLLYASCNSQVR